MLCFIAGPIFEIFLWNIYHFDDSALYSNFILKVQSLGLTLIVTSEELGTLIIQINEREMIQKLKLKI